MLKMVKKSAVISLFLCRLYPLVTAGILTQFPITNIPSKIKENRILDALNEIDRGLNNLNIACLYVWLNTKIAQTPYNIMIQ